MGNNLSTEEVEERKNIIHLLSKLDFNNFDLGERVGSTDYIDFVHPDELGERIDCVKGIDIGRRNFFVFKARFEFADEKYFDTFSIFFQRYSDDKLLWHCCGHHGTYLMNTEGGTNNQQFKLIYELLKKGSVKLNKEKCLECKLNFSKNNVYFDKIPDSKYPTQVKLLYH